MYPHFLWLRSCKLLESKCIECGNIVLLIARKDLPTRCDE
jgi:hypothetical protein